MILFARMSDRPARPIAAISLALSALCPLLLSCSHLTASPPVSGLAKIEHIIVIYAENRSFDNLYGLFPNANGVNQATPEQYLQLDHDGKAFTWLPPIAGKGDIPAITARLPNRPFRIDLPPVNLPLSVETRDLVHRFYQNQEQINAGKNNKFAALSDAGGLVMGYYDGSQLPLWQLAKDYVLADNFFMGAFGGSYLNHQWLVCACTPRDTNAPERARAQLDGSGMLKHKTSSPRSALQGPPQLLDGAFTPDGYSINTRQPPFQPSGIPPASNDDPLLADVSKHPLPPQHHKTIGDSLSEKGISWAWYADGWTAANADGQQPPSAKRQVIYNEAEGAINFQPHHQPFNYYQQFAPGTAARAQHLLDGQAFIDGISKGQLPQVAFYKPAGKLNEHPGYTDVLSGDQHIESLVRQIQQSSLWPSTAIIITYDENGGFWDHVAPPKGDRWGPGTRIPALIVSPFAKPHFVDHTPYDTTSIIKFISRRFDLQPLEGVRPQAGDLSNAFNLAD
ncbi:acid phosphatase [Methylosoma difficile]